MKQIIVFLLFVGVVLAFFFGISGNPAPQIPRDGRHKNITLAAPCRDCHAPGKDAPLKRTHPPKEECFKCHRPQRKK